jgi:hypothetical protein
VALGVGVGVGERLQPTSAIATSTSIVHRLTLLKNIVFTSLDLIQTAEIYSENSSVGRICYPTNGG